MNGEVLTQPLNEAQCQVTEEAWMEPENPGEKFFSARDWLLLAHQLKLSTRERTVAILLFEGKTRFQIACQIGCTPGTTRVYIDRLYQKLKVQDRVGLVLRCVRAHLLIQQDV